MTETALPSFVVFEGIDGAGTTTQANLLVDSLKAEGREALFTCEPSKGPVGTMIRDILRGAHGIDGEKFDPKSLALLFAADRLDHVKREIDPAINAGKIVICDRYLMSSLAYQAADLFLSTMNDGEEGDSRFERINWLSHLALNVRQPDLVLYLDVETEVAAKRRSARGSAERFEVDVFLKLVVDHYRYLAKRMKNVVWLDGGKDVVEVAAEVRDAVRRPW